MYEDSIPHCSTHFYQQHQFSTGHFANNTTSPSSPHHASSANGHRHPFPSSSQDDSDSHLQGSDRELERLHQHQLLTQLRLEVNSLRTQIQQLELLKQQLVLQKPMMQPAEYEQLMDQFLKTTASLLRVGNPSHFGGSQSSVGFGINGTRPRTRTVGSGDGDGGTTAAGGGAGAGAGGFGGNGPNEGGYLGMHMMQRLHAKLQSMTIQQHHQQHQEYAQKQRQLEQQQHQQHQLNGGQSDVVKGATRRPSMNGANPNRRDPVRMEQISLEAELRDLERRMKSIQLLG
ncbi:hypothetical protein B0O80DRAFT_502777 [Mortierella sp. GBAus27b]|nr:hypothetical protein BGX31_005945 [Mortierella sp. GBA43]KAI8347451.1 hypothetical protein B0O80DRAFT_502777 [Mortierella sp. GBAus27b]